MEMQSISGAASSSLEGVGGKQSQKFTMNGRFTLFGKLPLELKLMIWEMALPGPRYTDSKIVKIFWRNRVGSHEPLRQVFYHAIHVPGIQDLHFAALPSYHERKRL
jgi:hypothetical protein